MTNITMRQVRRNITINKTGPLSLMWEDEAHLVEIVDMGRGEYAAVLWNKDEDDNLESEDAYEGSLDGALLKFREFVARYEQPEAPEPKPVPPPDALSIWFAVFFALCLLAGMVGHYALGFWGD